jgi:hypothetical protein
MTADHLPRRLALSAVLTAAAVLSLLIAGCGGNSPPASASHSSGSSSASAPQGGDAARETAERRLEAIGPQLGAVLADYRSGKKQQAYSIAKSISTNLYEGTTEGVVSKMDPAGERQIDPLLAATLPAAIQSGAPASQIAVLTHRAQMLAASCLDTIHHSE